jgi:hypothetical protein
MYYTKETKDGLSLKERSSQENYRLTMVMIKLTGPFPQLLTVKGRQNILRIKQ